MASETRWVDRGQQIALDKAFRIAALAGQRAEVVFKLGKRTQPPGDLYKDAPCGNRELNKGNPAPAKRQQGSEQREDDERQVKNERCVRGETWKHRSGPSW